MRGWGVSGVEGRGPSADDHAVYSIFSSLKKFYMDREAAFKNWDFDNEYTNNRGLLMKIFQNPPPTQTRDVLQTMQTINEMLQNSANT
jgi:hypothetical protein